jgi:hypothetical protein
MSLGDGVNLVCHLNGCIKCDVLAIHVVYYFGCWSELSQKIERVKYFLHIYFFLLYLFLLTMWKPRVFYRQTPTNTMPNDPKPCPASFPECSGDPNDCLENDGFGCGKPYDVTVCKKCGGDMAECGSRMECTKCGHSFLTTSNKP